MSLPKIEYPEYDVMVPSTGKTYKMRPYTVGEEKILLMALESDSTKEIMDATKRLFDVCIKGLSFDELKPYDIDYLFIKIRGISVSETVDLAYRVNKCPLNDNNPCKNNINIKVNLNDAQIQSRKDGEWEDFDNSVDNKKKIQITENVGIQLSHPTFKSISEIGNDLDVPGILKELCISSIDMIWQEDTVYTRNDFSKEDAVEFFDSLPVRVREEIVQYIDNIPTLRYETTYSCPSCDFSTKIQLEGIADFFG